MRCRHCGWPISRDESTQGWAHVTDRPLNSYFCWDTKDYLDADYAEPEAANAV